MWLIMGLANGKMSGTNHWLAVLLSALVFEFGKQCLLQHTVNAAHILENKLRREKEKDEQSQRLKTNVKCAKYDNRIRIEANLRCDGGISRPERQVQINDHEIYICASAKVGLDSDANTNCLRGISTEGGGASRNYECLLGAR
jgi:hypothetical protein